MPGIKYKVTLTSGERQMLEEIATRGWHTAARRC